LAVLRCENKPPEPTGRHGVMGMRWSTFFIGGGE
jgi:hypothetical protein